MNQLKEQLILSRITKITRMMHVGLNLINIDGTNMVDSIKLIIK